MSGRRWATTTAVVTVALLSMLLLRARQWNPALSYDTETFYYTALIQERPQSNLAAALSSYLTRPFTNGDEPSAGVTWRAELVETRAFFSHYPFLAWEDPAQTYQMLIQGQYTARAYREPFGQVTVWRVKGSRSMSKPTADEWVACGIGSVTRHHGHPCYTAGRMRLATAPRAGGPS